MSKSSYFLDHPLEWITGNGDMADIAIFSKVLLRRNIVGYPFIGCCDDTALTDIEQKVRKKAEEDSLLKECGMWEVDDLENLSREVLTERHVFERESQGDRRMLLMDSRGIMSLRVNDDDHLLISAILGGLRPHESWRVTRSVDKSLAGLEYAFDNSFGYLTASPIYTGIAMTASILLHLPALNMTEQIQDIAKECQRIRLSIGNAYGKGTSSKSSFFILSNQATLGVMEDQVLEDLLGFASKLVQRERDFRDEIRKQHSAALEDRVWRAWGLLKYARAIDAEESLAMLSAVKLGSDMEILPRLSNDEWNRMILSVQPGHLQALTGNESEMVDMAVLRAKVIRQIFESKQ